MDNIAGRGVKRGLGYADVGLNSRENEGFSSSGKDLIVEIMIVKTVKVCFLHRLYIREESFYLRQGRAKLFLLCNNDRNVCNPGKRGKAGYVIHKFFLSGYSGNKLFLDINDYKKTIRGVYQGKCIAISVHELPPLYLFSGKKVSAGSI